MTSSGLKRPFEFPPHTSGPSGMSLNGPVANGNKRRCINFTPQSRVENLGVHCSSLFKDSSTILAPLSEDISFMIKDELNKNHGKEPLVLTIRQTQIICEKLIKDREQKLREEYDRILLSKLAEQYDTFVKYTHDHIEKRYNESNSHQASYLS